MIVSDVTAVAITIFSKDVFESVGGQSSNLFAAFGVTVATGFRDRGFSVGLKV